MENPSRKALVKLRIKAVTKLIGLRQVDTTTHQVIKGQKSLKLHRIEDETHFLLDCPSFIFDKRDVLL